MLPLLRLSWQIDLCVLPPVYSLWKLHRVVCSHPKYKVQTAPTFNTTVVYTGMCLIVCLVEFLWPGYSQSTSTLKLEAIFIR